MKNEEMARERASVLRDIRIATRQLDAGEGMSSRAAKAELRRRLSVRHTDELRIEKPE